MDISLASLVGPYCENLHRFYANLYIVNKQYVY